ncbi:MAG: MAPEG family protein, partial [Myxococcota bacterium]
MPDAASNQILYPAFALFALTLFVLNRMRSMRFAAVRSGEVSAGFYRAFQDGSEPEPLRVVSRHFVNLFEMPVLFYVGVLMVYVTHNVSGWMVGLAWSYV